MPNENEMCAVSISGKALDIAKREQEQRMNEKGVKMTLGAIVSEAVFEAFGKGK